MTAKCECLFCFKLATARLTVPRLQPRFFICDEHLAETLAWAEPYRKTAGRVLVESVTKC